jgi:MoxR-like ATPase
VERLADALQLASPERATLAAAVRRASALLVAGTAGNSRLSTLPVPLTRFVGRDREMAEVRRLLTVTRLLTLVGSGGIGKTRLALHVAEEIRDEGADTVALVELADLANPELVGRHGTIVG